MTPICAILELLPPGGGESDSDVEVLEGDSDVELVDEPGDGDAEGKWSSCECRSLGLPVEV